MIAYSEGIETRSGRAWVATIQFEGKKPCWFGTVIMHRDAKMHEVELAAHDLAHEHLPPGFKITNLQPGSLVFMPGDEPME